MAMDEVYELLKSRRDHWMSSKQISEEIGLSRGSVIRALNGLIKRGLVVRKQANNVFRRYIYGAYQIREALDEEEQDV